MTQPTPSPSRADPRNELAEFRALQRIAADCSEMFGRFDRDGLLNTLGQTIVNLGRALDARSLSSPRAPTGIDVATLEELAAQYEEVAQHDEAGTHGRPVLARRQANALHGAVALASPRADAGMRHVWVTNEMIEQLRGTPSLPVTVRIEEREAGELAFVATRHECPAQPRADAAHEDIDRAASLLRFELGECGSGCRGECTCGRRDAHKALDTLLDAARATAQPQEETEP